MSVEEWRDDGSGEFVEDLRRRGDDVAVVLDVRSREEFAEAHVPGR